MADQSKLASKPFNIIDFFRDKRYINKPLFFISIYRATYLLDIIFLKPHLNYQKQTFYILYIEIKNKETIMRETTLSATPKNPILLLDNIYSKLKQRYSLKSHKDFITLVREIPNQTHYDYSMDLLLEGNTLHYDIDIYTPNQTIRQYRYKQTINGHIQPEEANIY